jgi:SHS2 domain-containing protein
MIAGRWELFPHEADMGVRGVGSSKEEAFEQARTVARLEPVICIKG